ncbi:YdaS family helix-turn-helix protein [Pseudomonas sp. YL2]|jgi:DNA-binding transcriptional regulator YdaS (Cro superfamily)|uniref:YdaS family helix-turn-helix protein n=1 Tax=Pseudomonas sp. YL2 TaxID=2904251 RepID=UPI00406C7264
MVARIQLELVASIAILTCSHDLKAVTLRCNYQFNEDAMEQNAAERAAKAAGGQSALARVLGCTPQNVQRWCATGRVPAERVIPVEQATGVSRHDLRPDLYPDESSKAA